jgi:hypothetical protein
MAFHIPPLQNYALRVAADFVLECTSNNRAPTKKLLEEMHSLPLDLLHSIMLVVIDNRLHINITRDN